LKANETTLDQLLGAPVQYQVPLYQRTYSWADKQLSQLWSDLVSVADNFTNSGSQSTHFLGSMVLAPSPSNTPAKVQEWLIVDGQQRLTTLSLLFSALRDHLLASDGSVADKFNQLYLVNQWANGSDRFKLLPTQLDRESYIAVIERTPGSLPGPIGHSYRYYRRQIDSLEAEDPELLEHLDVAIARGLSLVVITAQSGDNVYRIFESLNNTGLRLTQADLLRNYLFMRMPTRGEHAYDTLWMPLQRELSPDELELLVWLDLVLRGYERTSRDEIYREQQARLEKIDGEERLEDEIKTLVRRMSYLRVILHPSAEHDPAVRHRLSTLAEWGSQTVYPAVMALLERRDHKTASSEQVANAMSYLESFLVRRMIVGKATNNLNRILAASVSDLEGEKPVDEVLRSYLSESRHYWPTDEQLRRAIVEDPFYWRGRHSQRTFVLRRLEESYGSPEPVDLAKLTIEHVMPQTPEEEWWASIGEDSAVSGETEEALHHRLVHTLGNLTLTGYNLSLSNQPFTKKRILLSDSGLRMNQEIARCEVWRSDQILARAERIAETAIHIWPGPVAGAGSPDDNSRWQLLTQALVALPTGAWTTYGDLAELIGSSPMGVGTHLATKSVPNAHRALSYHGRVSEGFAWLEPGRTDDPVDVLKSEGVVFLPDGTAHPGQRFTANELADLVGIERDGAPEESVGEGGAAERFEEQLRATGEPRLVDAVTHLIGAWRAGGGELAFGSGASASASLKLLPYGHNGYVLWCGVIYLDPSSPTFEVPFRYLKSKEPFSDPNLREELRIRLNVAPAISIPPTKISVRPSFPLSVLTEEENLTAVLGALQWLQSEARVPIPAEETAELSGIG
jgi:alkylated DNA nucleotide flippase Atl1